MRTDASFHRRSDPQGLMNPAKVVVHVKQSNHGGVVLKLLAEGVRQASESAHVHTHVEILTLHVASRDVLLIRGADHFDALGAKTLRGAVALLSLRIVAEYLDQLRVVDLVTERVRNSRQIHLVAVRGQLDSIRQPACNILKEVRCTPRVPPAYGPTDNKLRLRFNRGEGPNVSSVAHAFPHFRRGVLFLGVAERPDFINLDTLRRNVAKSDVLVLLASLTDAHQKAKDSALRHTSKAHRGTHGASFDQCRDDRDFLRRADYVCHDSTIRQRFRIVKIKVTGGADLLAVLGLRPTCFSSLTSATPSLFVRHGFQPALAADLTAFRSHLAHDLLNNGKLRGLSGLHENAASVLNGVEFLSSACPLWHTPKRCTDYTSRQEGSISNGPTTQNLLKKEVQLKRASERKRTKKPT